MALQGALFLPPSEWKAPRLSDLPSWDNAGRVSVDIETCDPQLQELGPGVRRGGFIAGIGFAFEDGPAFYVPLRHEGGDNVENPEAALQYFRDQAASFPNTLVGCNLLYDLDFLAEVGVHFKKVQWIRDVQVAEPLIDELQDRYSLDAIAARYKIEGKKTELMDHACAAFGLKGRSVKHAWKLPARFVGPYAIQDCYLPLQLLRRQEREIEEQELWEVYNLESKLLPVLLKMRRRGVRFSHDRLEEVERWSIEQETLALQKVYDLTGERIELGNVWAPEAFVKALARIGVVPPNTAKGKPSITADFLKSVKHEMTPHLLRARQVNKLRTTFVQSIRNYAIKDRIHCVINQLRREDEETDDLKGAAFGRCSSEHPNLQQQPARDEEMGPMWRRIYIPDEGKVWACLDYSQQEPRLLTHYAELTGCRGAFEAAERYRNDPSMDNHQMMADMTGLPRKKAKDIFLGKCYGMGGALLCHKLGLPTAWIMSERLKRMIEVAGDEGKALINQFDRRAPYVKKLAEMCEARATEVGFIRTLSGRKCRFPKKDDGTFDWVHKALNRLIQGGSGDQTKSAMVAGDEAGYELQLQVHDELDLSVDSREHAQGLAEIMMTVTPLRVPSKVDVEVGPSWGECE